MLNGRQKVVARIASSILLAASALVATPAPAQTGGGTDSEYDWYCCSASGCGYYYQTGYGVSCCYWAGYAWWDNNAHWGLEPCTLPMFQAPGEADDTAVPKLSDPAGNRPAANPARGAKAAPADPEA